MRFFEAAANWADRKAVDVKFARDEYDGWFAILSFSDSRGPYSTVVNAIPGGVRNDPDYQGRIDRMMDGACVAAHKGRMRRQSIKKAA